MQPLGQPRVAAGLVLQDAYVLLGREHQYICLSAVHGIGHLPVEGLGVVDIRTGAVCEFAHGSVVIGAISKKSAAWLAFGGYFQ